MIQLDFPLRKNCPYSELFWSAFSGIRTQYGETRNIPPYSVQKRKNADQNAVLNYQLPSTGWRRVKLYQNVPFHYFCTAEKLSIPLLWNALCYSWFTLNDAGTKRFLLWQFWTDLTFEQHLCKMFFSGTKNQLLFVFFSSYRRNIEINLFIIRCLSL